MWINGSGILILSDNVTYHLEKGSEDRTRRKIGEWVDDDQDSAR